MLGFAATVVGERLTGRGAIGQVALWAGSQPTQEYLQGGLIVMALWGVGWTLIAFGLGGAGWRLGQPPRDGGDAGMF